MADYDAFISYARDPDEKFAPKLKEAMLKLGKKWNQRRALNVFLDNDALESSAGLQDSLQKALDKSRFLIILASPGSASSRWVGEEVDHWKESGKSWQNIRLVLTEGTIAWDDAKHDFDFEKSTAVGAGLSGAFPAEPLWCDMTEFSRVDSLDIRSDGSWKKTVATLAAPLWPAVGDPPRPISKEDLVGEDLVQFKRAKRLRRVAVIGLATLTVLAVIAGIVAIIQRQTAITQARRAESRAMAGQALINAETDRDLSALLALESVRVADTSEARGSLLGILGFPSRFQERTNEHPDQPVTAVAFSESGSRAATGDAAGRIVMWNLDSTDPLHPATPDDLTFDLSPRGIAKLLFGEFEGQLVLAAAADDGEFVAWDALTGEQLDAFSSPDYPGDFWVSSDLAVFAGASGGTMIVSDSDGNSIDEVPLVGGDSSVVKNAAIHPSDPPSIAWVELIEDQDGGAYGVVIRNPQNDAPLEFLNPPFVSEPTNLAFSPDGSLVVAGEVDGAIWVFDVATQEVVGKMEPTPVNPPVALVFDPARSTAPFTLASAHTNGEVLLWEVFEDGGVLTDRLLGHNEVIRSLAFGAGGEIASGSFEGEVIWWSKDPQFVFGNLVPSSGERHEIDVAQVSFLDDDVVVSLDTDGNLLLASITDGIGEFVKGIEQGLVKGIAATADTLAVGFVDGTVFLLIGDTERALQTAHTDPVGLVELSPDAQGLVTGSRSADGEPFDSIAVWDAATGELLSTPELPDDFEVFSALHPGGDVIWLGGRDTQGPVALRFDATSGRLSEPPLRHGTAEQIGALAEERVTSMAVTSDGKLLVTGGSDRKIHAWNLDTMKRAGGSFVGHNEAVTGLAFIEDDERLISADRDLFVNYWDVSERLLITSFGGPSDGISDIALSPDGSTLAVASEDDFVHTWTLDANDWIERACLLAGRNMTQAEWNLYGRGSYVRHCDFPGEGGLADYGRILTTKRPIAESTAPASADDEPTVTAAVNAPTSLDPTSEPATTATRPPATTVTPATAEDQAVPVDTWTFELYNQEFNFDDFDVPADATQLTVSIDRTTSPDVDLFVYEPGVYVPGTDPAGPGVFCASYGDGSEESCTIDGPTPGPWTIIVFNLEASDSPPDLIDVTFTLATE